MNRMTTREGASLPRFGLFGDDFDRVFEGFFRPVRSVEEATSESFVPSMDIVERENEYVVRTDLPGVKKEDIQITMENGLLTILAECRGEDRAENDRYLRQERRFGKYARSLRLGTQVNEKAIKANYRDGVLELVLPKAEEVKPRKISVDVG